jgi:hypothetical protein
MSDRRCQMSDRRCEIIAMNKEKSPVKGPFIFFLVNESTPHAAGQASQRINSNRCQLNLLLQLHNVIAEYTICIHKVFNRLAGMDHRGMISSAEVFTNGLQ